MDWNQNYIERHKKLVGWGFRNVVNSRVQRFKTNPPVKPSHFSELKYLILHYDYDKVLLKKYEDILSEDFKTKWLEKNLQQSSKYSNNNYHVYGILLPFYLINPETQIELIDKHFLNDQLLLILGGVDHKLGRYHWRANYLFEFLIPNFDKLKPNFRIRIIELLTHKSNGQCIRNINRLIFNNIDVIDKGLITNFVAQQIKKQLVNSKMAIGYLKRFRELNNSIVQELKTIILRLENGEHILNGINKC